MLGAHASGIRGPTHDDAAAGPLLDEAGWARGADGVRAKAGRRLELTMVVSEPELQRPMPELVQAELRQLGIAVTLELNPDAYYDKLKKGAGDIFAEVGNQNDANPIFFGALFTDHPGGFPEYGAAFGPGSAYDGVLAQAIGAPDTEQVRKLAADAMRIAVDEQVVAVPLAGIKRIWGLRANARGFVPHPAAVHQRWDRVSLAA